MSRKNRKKNSPPVNSARLQGEGLQVSLRKVKAHHSGPLPTPQTLAHYNEILPGAAERILVMAEKHSEHFCEMERGVLETQREMVRLDHEQKTRGQNYALATSLVMAGVSLLSLFMGHPGVAGAIGTTTIVGLVTIFVTGQSGTNSSGKNREGKEEG